MAIYDAARRRQGKRNGRERGCWIYVPLEELERAGYSRDDDPPFYRLWTPKGRKTMQVQFYREQ